MDYLLDERVIRHHYVVFILGLTKLKLLKYLISLQLFLYLGEFILSTLFLFRFKNDFFVVGVWWVLAVGCGKGLALHSGYNPPHLVWPNCGWLWHHNLTTKPATFLVGLWCKCGGGYHNVPRVGPHPRHTSATHRPHSVVEVWQDRINRVWSGK